jgi:hypothetical protein
VKAIVLTAILESQDDVAAASTGTTADALDSKLVTLRLTWITTTPHCRRKRKEVGPHAASGQVDRSAADIYDRSRVRPLTRSPVTRLHFDESDPGHRGEDASGVFGAEPRKTSTIR